MGKPRLKSRVAGERIVVEDDEQGDIEQVVDAIGDDLEEALYGMIPRCATCGGDFLTYLGEISIVGSLKYHKECFLTGRPGATGGTSLTLDAVQAAKYLPDNIVLKLSTATPKAKVFSTLFFVWKDKDVALRSMRSSTERQDHLSVQFDLDETARANPNYKGRNSGPKAIEDPINLTLDLIGGDSIAPQPPRLVEGLTMTTSGYQNGQSLRAKIGYSKYSLNHSLVLHIPCNVTGTALELVNATLTVTIEEPTPV